MPEHPHYQSYLTLKSSLALPLKIKMYYSLLEDTYLKTNSPTLKNQVKKYKNVLTAFKRFAQDEQERFMYETLRLVKIGLSRDQGREQGKDQGKEEGCNSSQSDGMENIKEIQCSCKVKDSFLGFVKWQKKCFKLNTKAYRLKLTQNKKQSLIVLPYYFVRKSTKHPKTLTLFSISQQIQPSKSQIYINFDNSILFQQIYNHIFICMVEINAKEILRLAREKDEDKDRDRDEEGNGEIMGNDQISKASTILNQKMLNQYFQIREKIMRKLENYGYKFEKVDLPEQDANTKISICKDKNKDRIKIQKTYKLPLTQLTQKLSILTRTRSQNLIQFQILETFSTNISVVYFKYYFNNEVYEFLAILEQNTKKDEKTLIFKGIDNFINKQFVDFLCFKLRDHGDGCTGLKVMGIIKKEQKNKNQAVQFLLSLIQVSEGKGETRERKTEEFWTVREMENIEMEDQDQDQDEYYGPGLQNEDVLTRSRKFSSQYSKTDKTLFNKAYILQPKSPTNTLLTLHPLFKQWRVHKNGGVLCTDEEQINVQKKVFKHVISQIGSNIIQRKNILNISFPVVIFKKESHLKSVARNFSFASIFLEKVVKGTPEEKIQAAVLFQISTAILVISMNKPFNPVLGETYQGFIDGCPIFLEQVSHHPPISRYLFIGRGYRIYGTIEPKVAVGLNCVKGWSPPLNFIEFEDGTLLQFTMNKMVINGMLFGERTFNFEGVNFIFDHKNKLAAEISYGCESNSVFKKKELTYDSVSGAIYRLSNAGQKIGEDFLKKNDKERLHTFNGTWHSQMNMDGKPVYNFYKDLPYDLIDYENPIPSDSCYRSDLKVLIKGDLEAAQKEKQFVEEIQRRDKKLRQSYRLSKKSL